MGSLYVLSKEDLEKAAPAIYSLGAHPAVSDHYRFIPTFEVIEALQDSGWHPVRAIQPTTRTPTGKHLVAFRSTEAREVRGVMPELLLYNSHDRTSTLSFFAGAFRFVCSNGLVVGEKMEAFRSFHLREHLTMEDVIEAARGAAVAALEKSQQFEEMSNQKLSYREEINFALKAAAIRWPEAEKTGDFPVRASHLIAPRRFADTEHDLWTVYNVVQENVIRGGIPARSPTGRSVTTRPISGVVRSLDLNRRLWKLAEDTSEYLKAA